LRRVRAVVQRVTSASVTIDGAVVGAIGRGLLVLLGVAVDDDPPDEVQMAEKLANLRIFADDAGLMNRSVLDAGGDVLVVSQFTLLGDTRKGRRPSFVAAARGDEANARYESVVARLRALGLRVETGRFGADMAVALVNDGPVTILIDTKKAF
jgi:D-tyrosyl-tRNA(Tyr) deacylase